MKRYIALGIAGATILALFGLTMVSAQTTSDVTTEAQIERIRQNCQPAQRTLNQLYRNSDVPNRINLGQSYDQLAQNLMIPLNNRMASNNFPTVEQVSTVTNFQRNVTTFRDTYAAYREQLLKAIKMDCRNQPVQFYDDIQQVRALREKVYASIQNINKDIVKYRNDFEAFAKSLKKPAKE